MVPLTGLRTKVPTRSRRPQGSPGTWSLEQEGRSDLHKHALARVPAQTRTHVSIPAPTSRPGRTLEERGRLVPSGLRVRKLRPGSPSLKESSHEKLLFGVG